MKNLALLPALALAALVVQAQEAKPWTGVLDEASFAALHELTDDAAPPLLGEDVEVDGAKGYLSLPSGTEMLGGVVVIHEWWGLNEHVKHWTDRLAADGYAALAIDLYEGKVATTRDEARAAYGSVDSDKAIATLQAAHSFLVDEHGAPRTACIGWCFGGGWSLKLAIAQPELDAAVIYYGRLEEDPAVLESIQAPVMGVFGNQDNGIPPTAVDAFAKAMEKAGKSLELRQYDAEHAFANPSSGRYDAQNAAAAWRETRGFLCANLWPEDSRAGLLASGRKLRFDAPKGWEDQGERKMRLATFQVTPNVECYVSAFRGEAGGVKPNFDRWGVQMGGVELSEAEIAALPRVPVMGALAPVARLDGPYTPKGGELVDAGTMLGAIATRGDETVFVKLLGPTDEVEAQRMAFDAFCRSLR